MYHLSLLFLTELRKGSVSVDLFIHNVCHASNVEWHEHCSQGVYNSDKYHTASHVILAKVLLEPAWPILTRPEHIYYTAPRIQGAKQSQD